MVEDVSVTVVVVFVVVSVVADGTDILLVDCVDVPVVDFSVVVETVELDVEGSVKTFPCYLILNNANM